MLGVVASGLGAHAGTLCRRLAKPNRPARFQRAAAAYGRANRGGPEVQRSAKAIALALEMVRMAMRVFLLRMLAAKNSRNRRTACSPASAIAAGTASVLRKPAALTGAAASMTVGRLRRSALTPTPYR